MEPEEPDPDMKMVTYHHLMEELKLRLAAIRGMEEELQHLVESPHAFILAESCLLQLRFCCEIVALATQAVHSDLITKRHSKDYQAEKIIKTLIGINPNAFPQAIDMTETSDGFSYVFVSHNNIEPAELYRLYQQCGEYLHRGSYDKLVTEKPRVYDIEFIRGWMWRLAAFIDNHTILLDGNEEVFVVSLSGGDDEATLVQRGRRKP